MIKLFTILKQTLIEKNDIKKIIILFTERSEDGEGIKSIDFKLIYNDGKEIDYKSEASPYLNKTFLFYVKKGWYGKAMNLVKQNTKRIILKKESSNG
jgi:hypothetical protein